MSITMLQFRGFVFITVLCAANAAFTINVYDEGTAVEHSVKDVSTCKNEDCDAECRSIGCARGQCAGEDCYCDIWRSINEIKLSRNGIAVKKNIKARRCDDQDCDRQCRQHGFSDGKCIDDFCTCTAKQDLNEQDKLQDNKLGLKKTIKDLNKCNEHDCYQDCIKFGYISGTCVGNTCTCKIRLSEGTAVERSEKDVSTCKNEDCDAECRSIGCASGQCAGEDCYCDIWRSINEIKLSRNRTALEKNIKARRCDDQDCDRQCRQHGFSDGRCIDDFCTCTAKQDLHVYKLQDNKLGLKRTVKDLNKCNEHDCYQDCIKFGYISGTCVINTCTCKVRLSEEAISNIEDNEVTSNEITECTQFTCRRICQYLGRTGGKCFLGKCQCNLKLGPLFQVLINDESQEKNASVVVN